MLIGGAIACAGTRAAADRRRRQLDLAPRGALLRDGLRLRPGRAARRSWPPQSAVTWQHRGVATGTAMFARSVGSAVGVAVFGAIANAVVASHLGRGVPDLEHLTPERAGAGHPRGLRRLRDRRGRAARRRPADAEADRRAGGATGTWRRWLIHRFLPRFRGPPVRAQVLARLVVDNQPERGRAGADPGEAGGRPDRDGRDGPGRPVNPRCPSDGDAGSRIVTSWPANAPVCGAASRGRRRSAPTPRRLAPCAPLSQLLVEQQRTGAELPDAGQRRRSTPTVASVAGECDRPDQRAPGTSATTAATSGRRATGSAATASEQQQEQRGPDQVELLLHRQRPVVLERRGRQALGEVVGAQLRRSARWPGSTAAHAASAVICSTARYESSTMRVAPPSRQAPGSRPAGSAGAAGVERRASLIRRSPVGLRSSRPVMHSAAQPPCTCAERSLPWLRSAPEGLDSAHDRQRAE